MRSWVGAIAVASSLLAAAPGWASAELNWATGLQAALPADAGAGPDVSLYAISCPSAGACSAVGEYRDGASQEQGLLLRQIGGTWAPGVKAVLPGNATGTFARIGSVSCWSAGECVAAGVYASTAGTRGLLVSESGGTWGAGVEAPLPANASLSSPAVTIAGVSCPSAGNCGAVGTYTTAGGPTAGLLLTQSAGTWQPTQAVLPAGGGSAPTLEAVSCPAPGTCAAVGEYNDASAHRQGLLFTASAGSWAAGAKATLPAGAHAIPQVLVSSVSCGAAGACAAGGEYRDGAGSTQGLLLYEASGNWGSGVAAALPAAAGTTPNATLRAVSCVASGDCAAAGTYVDNAGHTQMLLVSGSAGTWDTGIRAPLPANAAASPGAAARSVSCLSAGACTASGGYVDGASAARGLLVSESGGVWRTGVAVAMPANAGTSPGNGALSVSCGAAGWCGAAGRYLDGSGFAQGLLVNASPASPALSVSAPVSVPPGGTVAASAVAGLLSGGAAPTGTLTFSVFGPQAAPPTVCTSGGTKVGTATVTGNGSYSPGAGFTPAQAGHYWWHAGYDGDTSDHPAASTCGAGMAETVVLAAPSLTVGAPAAGTAGTTIRTAALYAVLAGGAAPTGTLTFRVLGPQAAPPSSCASGGTIVGTAAVTSNGFYRPPAGFTPRRAGSYWWHVAYDGDGGNTAAGSACGATMPKTVVARSSAPRVRMVGKPRFSGAGLVVRLKCLARAGRRCRTSETLATLKGAPLAHTTATIAAAVTKRVTLTLNAVGRRLLARQHRLRVRLTVMLATRVALTRRLTIATRRG